MVNLESGDGGKETASKMVLPNLTLATKEKTPVVLNFVLFCFVFQFWQDNVIWDTTFICKWRV